jgi:hypothetical protein
MAENKESVQEKNPFKKGATRHCCYGQCNSDSRYADRPHMQGVHWIPFPKPGRNLDKCQKWLHACGRQNFTKENVTKWTYICSKHFVGGQGPTAENPDPIPATFTPQQVSLIFVEVQVSDTYFFIIFYSYDTFFIFTKRRQMN